jgi:hypothetical protein
MIPEFIGRVPMVAVVDPLDEEALMADFDRTPECTGEAVSETAEDGQCTVGFQARRNSCDRARSLPP